MGQESDRMSSDPAAPAVPSPCASPGPFLSPSELSQSLERRLREERCFETEEGLVKRREVLKNLTVLIQQWIQVRLFLLINYTNGNIAYI